MAAYGTYRIRLSVPVGSALGSDGIYTGGTDENSETRIPIGMQVIRSGSHRISIGSNRIRSWDILTWVVINGAKAIEF
jgi:hypothetical protein